MCRGPKTIGLGRMLAASISRALVIFAYLLAPRYSCRRNPNSSFRQANVPARSPNLLLDAAVEKYYDLIMVLVLVGTTIFGFWKGMAWQLASLASLIVSYFGALRFSEQLAPVIKLDPPLNRFVAMLLIYVCSSFIIWMLFRLVAGAIDKVRLESFDRQLGAMFGFAKGVLLCVVITFFAVTFLPQDQGQAIVESQSGQVHCRPARQIAFGVPTRDSPDRRSVSRQG